MRTITSITCLNKSRQHVNKDKTDWNSTVGDMVTTHRSQGNHMSLEEFPAHFLCVFLDINTSQVTITVLLFTWQSWESEMLLFPERHVTSGRGRAENVDCCPSSLSLGFTVESFLVSDACTLNTLVFILIRSHCSCLTKGTFETLCFYFSAYQRLVASARVVAPAQE